MQRKDSEYMGQRMLKMKAGGEEQDLQGVNEDMHKVI